MPTKTPPKSFYEEVITACEKAAGLGHRPPGVSGNGPAAIAIAADSLGRSRTTVQNQVVAAWQHYKIKPDWSVWRRPEAQAVGDEAPLAEIERQRFRDDAAFLRRELKAAHKQINEAEDLRKSLFDLHSRPLEPSDWFVDTQKPVKGPGVPLLHTSDFQWGELVRPEDIDGINEYSVAIAKKRYRRLIERTIDLCFEHMVTPDYPGIVLLRGGDSIHGDIRAEFLKYNELKAIPAVKSLAEEEARGLNILADRFGKVEVISVPGNHGRTTIKPESQGAVDTNYDDLLSWMLEWHFQGDKRIHFTTPRSGDAYFKVYNLNLLMVHGDRIGSRGGQGFIGPAATIMRGVKKVLNQYAILSKPVDYIFLGHFHVEMSLPGAFANGSLVGFNTFARDLRATPEPPTQTLFFIHPRRGVTCRWPIRVDDPPPAREAAWFDLPDYLKAGP